ncbi:AraC-like ligand-binding domain-containing protein [Glutamicibacter sp. X7]
MELLRADSFSSWKELISSAFVPLDALPVDSRPFTGTISASTFQDIGFMHVKAHAQTVIRTRELIAANDGAFYKLSLQLAGTGLLQQDGHQARLVPGSLAIYDTQRPYTLQYQDDFSCLVLIFPQQLLSLSPEDVRSMTATAMNEDSPLAGSIIPFIRQINEQLPSLPAAVGHRLALNVVDLLSTLMAERIYSSPGSSTDSHSSLLLRIKHYVEAHLADTGLCAQSIAEAHYIAVRTLQKLFSSTGYTVARWIRERRMEHSRRDLADPLYEQVPIGAIGARWGYPDAAHFSRVFRATFDCSPTQYRAESLNSKKAAS